MEISVNECFFSHKTLISPAFSFKTMGCKLINSYYSELEKSSEMVQMTVFIFDGQCARISDMYYFYINNSFKNSIALFYRKVYLNYEIRYISFM